MKILQKMKGGNNTKLAKTIASLLLVILLTSGIFAVNNIDTTESSDDVSSGTTLSPASLTATRTSPEREKSFTEVSSSEGVPARVSISLDPRKQTSAGGEATYKVIVKAHYLPDTDALRVTEYKLNFEPEDKNMKGEFDTESFTLQPGEKKAVELKVYAENSGDHKFTVKVVDENRNEAKSEGLLSVLDSNTEPSQKIKLDLKPEKQYTETGYSEYALTVYRPIETACYSNRECAALYSAQEYELVLVSEQESLSGKFQSANPVSLKPGEKISVPLEITAKEKGTYVFKVYAKTSDYETGVRGLLVYGKEPQEPQPPSVSSSSYLNGEGFAINEDQSGGILVYLHLLGNEEIRGKMVFGKELYALKGQLSDSGTEVDFSFYDPEDGGFDKGVGEFHGEIQRFDNFAVLRGGIDFEISSYPNQYWVLTVIGKQNSVFENKIIVAQSNTPITKTINKEEVVTIRQGQPKESDVLRESEAKETYIVPEKIERKKIFGLIPNPWGDKVLNVKLVEGNTITEETVEEFGTNKIGDYEVSIGSLENEDAIEVSVTKTTQTQSN